MNITVYLGANAGNDPALAAAVRELGSWIGANGHRLVYGGSRSGLMGQLAQSALDAGGTVTGVEPQFFVQQELQHDGLTELIVTKDMTERKTKMIELGDAFIAFPGGTGTLEEIAEVMSKVSLGQLDAPCILYDLNGYYDSLKALLAKMIEKGLSTPQRQQGIRFAANLEEITTILNKASKETLPSREAFPFYIILPVQCGYLPAPSGSAAQKPAWCVRQKHSRNAHSHGQRSFHPPGRQRHGCHRRSGCPAEQATVPEQQSQSPGRWRC